jgi:acetyltransferase
MLSILSKESLRTRFFSTIKDISHERLILFCNIDYDRHMAIVAAMEENGQKSMIGVARLMMNQDLTSGEPAVLVQDKFQGKRLGTKFLEVLIKRARERGLEEVRADVLSEKVSMLKVFRRSGFKTRWVPGGTSDAVLKLKS